MRRLRRGEGKNHGGVLIMTLVLLGMFLVIFSSLTGYVTKTYHQAVLQTQDEIAFQMAEDGLNYGRWRLEHDNDNYTAETRNVSDQFAGVLGSFDLTFEAPVPGNPMVVITSVGRSIQQPNRPVTLKARYGKESLARYAYVVNSDLYYAFQIHGILHSNGGIRMDGQSDNLVQSAKETYMCGTFGNCDPPTVKPGVWGSGTDQNLWEFPVPAIDYESLTVDLTTMKTRAQSLGTYYGPSGIFGYHVVFNTNNTYSIFRVTSKEALIHSCDFGSGGSYTCDNLSHDIDEQELLETRAVPSGGVIFTEDHLWVEGDIRDRITVAAGVFPDIPATNADIILNGSISYGGVEDGTRVFGALAQRHVLIPWSGAADTLSLDGAFMAQGGKFGRRYYEAEPHKLKQSIDIFGMVGSNTYPGTSWLGGAPLTVLSGYQNKVQTYDSNLFYYPPPYFPTVGNYQFISWEVVE